MPRPVTVDMAGLSTDYDVFFVDQFGVLRDDIGPYQGAIDALRQLSQAGKKIVILSNSGRSGQYNAERLVKLGFAPDSFDFFVTSGDVAFELLSRPGVDIPKGSRALTISSGGDTNLADRLDLVSIRSGNEANIVIISGSEAERISMNDYREMLRPAAENNVACYCTNPDIHKLHEGSVAPGAGSIAQLYEAMGGRVTWIGKPYPEIYDHALKLVGVEDRRRVVCIGDSVEHDIVGARSAGLDSVLVRTGILADSNDGELERITSEGGATPTYMMQAFKC
ncbi:HAD family hydrolase [Rhizobium sp. AC44/96]|uniref:TIGR01459 family HAD-type hydrolase n=1 Tax=unclassified Rhizobium TaxID=2613769 RepID=UPI00080F93FC|nr:MULTISPECIES: TIGR01459 family HAD-type hydrolase [unclassified Rhizobium]MDM9621963.1 TIGR01459 family HAD-type hydrolase [Rhizobium sp. S96]OCJ17233.1 HAD family hydrolase [Rhizobium sp. AC44/96]